MSTAPPAPESGWTNRRARRRAERARALDLHTAARARYAKQTAAERAAGKAEDPMGWPLRILAGLVALVVLAVAVVIGVVVIGAGVGFYEHNLTVKTISFAALGVDTPLDLPTFTPIATEGVVWATTLLAVVMVLLNRVATLWTRSMWFFASIAAFVSTWHAVFEEHDLFGGALRGGLSLAGPYLVHLFILWCRHLRTGRTLEQARVDTEIRWAGVRGVLLSASLLLGRHVAHPVIAGRALGYRLGVGHWSYADAWAAASIGYRRGVQARLDGTHVGLAKRLRSRMSDAAEPAPPVASAATAETVDERPAPSAPVGLRPAFTEEEADELAARLADPRLTAEAFGDQREHPTGAGDREATAPRPDTTGGTRPKATEHPTETATEGDRRRPVGRAKRRPKLRSEATDVDVSDLLPAAREVATELGDRLSRDALLDGLRARGLPVGGRRRAAIYGVIQNELGRG